jgi:hypothetical protein
MSAIGGGEVLIGGILNLATNCPDFERLINTMSSVRTAVVKVLLPYGR